MQNLFPYKYLQMHRDPMCRSEAIFSSCSRNFLNVHMGIGQRIKFQHATGQFRRYIKFTAKDVWPVSVQNSQTIIPKGQNFQNEKIAKNKLKLLYSFTCFCFYKYDYLSAVKKDSKEQARSFVFAHFFLILVRIPSDQIYLQL